MCEVKTKRKIREKIIKRKKTGWNGGWNRRREVQEQIKKGEREETNYMKSPSADFPTERQHLKKAEPWRRKLDDFFFYKSRFFSNFVSL